MAKKCCRDEKKCDGKVNIQPLGDRVVVEREDALETTAGGIVLPDSAKEKPARGVVIAVGPGRVLDNGERSDFQVKPGDSVIFSSYAGDEFKFGDRKLLLMRESDIFAVVE
ncbi:MAG: co-chaperone GroES [Planctomycetia bacterium]|nr:co-chaperone GroES [Planctomycetia bacterium]